MKKVLLLGIYAAAIMVILLSAQHQPKNLKFNDEKESKDRGDARGMIDYFKKINGDPNNNGAINMSYYEEAVKQEKNAIASRSGSNFTWKFLGPDNIGGRTRAILFDKNTPNKVFAAGVSGGLWVSLDDGQSWTEWSGSDTLANMWIVSITQDAAGTIYFGTGEGLYNWDLQPGIGEFGGGSPGDGVWRSNDDGATFEHLTKTIPGTQYEAATWATVDRLAANPNSADSVIAAIYGGVYVSGDAGNNWVKASGIIAAIPMADVKFAIDGKHVFATSHQLGNLYVSSNGGKSFIRAVYPNPLKENIGRIEIGVSPTNANYAYAALINADNESLAYVIKTSNGGVSWSVIGTGTGFVDQYYLNGFDPTGNQGDYDVAVAVSPLDTNTVFVGGIDLWRYNPTQGWLQISDYGSFEYYNTLHADIHNLQFDPTNSSRLIIGCDGGIIQSLDPFDADATGVLYSSLNRGYDVTQYYSMSADSFGEPIAGAQDNGTEQITGQGNAVSSPPYHTVSNLSANILGVGGDGCETLISLSNNSAYFAEAPLGGLARSSNAGGSFSSFFDSIIQEEVGRVGAGFYSPFTLWEDTSRDSISAAWASHKPDRSLFAYGLNSGEVWVTPDAINFGTSPVWFRLQNLTGNVTATQFSLDGKYLYVGTDAGNLYRYSGFDSVFKKNAWNYPIANKEFVYTWNPADSGIVLDTSTFAGFSGRTILSIAIDPNDSNHLIVTCGNYSGSGVPYIAKSHNAEQPGGFTFVGCQGIGATALPYAPVYASCITRETTGGYPYILVGTPVGVWTSTDDGTTWAADNTAGLANVTTMSIKESPLYGSYAIYVGTHGRGMFVSYTLTTSAGIKQINSPVSNLTVFPNPLSSTGHIQYTLKKQGDVIIKLYDITGRYVKQISNQNTSAGPVDIQFNVADLVSGTYIVQLTEGSSQATQKLVVIH